MAENWCILEVRLVNWWEIQVLSESALEELLIWRLEDFGCCGAASQSQGSRRLIQAYLHQNQVQESDLQALAQLLSKDAEGVGSPPSVHWQVVAEEDWANNWKAHWHPQPIGDRLLIYPAWLPLPDTDRLLLRLDPGVAFGTGAHATTQLCLEAIEQQLKDQTANSIVLADIGCGTGILSIAAILLGAAQAYAVDTDPLAVGAAEASRALNGIDPQRVIVAQGSIEQLRELLEHPVDGIVCNILADVIIDLVPQIAGIVKPTTWGIFSGMLVTQTQPVINILEQHGWTISGLQQQQDWCCLSAYRA